MSNLDRVTVEAALADWRTAPISEPLRATLGLLERLTREPESLTVDDVLAVRASGVSAEAIAEAMIVCFLFSIIDRLADAFDFPVPSPGGLKRIALARNIVGYRLL